MDVNVAMTIKTLLAEQPDAPETDASRIPDDLNLLDFVGSFGFVHLLMDVESRLGLTLDLESVELDVLSRLDALCKFVSAQLEVSAESAPGAVVGA